MIQVTDRARSFRNLTNTSRLSEEQFPPWDAAPPEAKRPEFPENGFAVLQIYLLDVGRESPQCLDSDSMRVLRIRGTGPAASGPVHRTDTWMEFKNEG